MCGIVYTDIGTMNKKLLPLAILEMAEDDSIEGITRFQKLVFLAQREEIGEDIYSYVAGSYGPYSKPLYDDIDRLVDKGFIDEVTKPTLRSSNEDKQVYRLKDKGKRALDRGFEEEEVPFSSHELEAFLDDYNQMGLWDLLEYVYEEYPEMAENSKLPI